MRTLLVCSSILLYGVASGQGFGPIATRNHRALSLAFLRFEPRGSLLEPGQRSLDVSFVTANEFRNLSSLSGTVAEDYEVERLGVLYRQALRDGLEWSVEVPLLSRGGGFQDPIIDWWHANLLHWSDEDRNARPFGHSSISIPGSDKFGSAGGVGDISGFISKSIGRHWIATAGLKLPTGSADKLLGSGGLDAGAYIEGRWAINSKWSISAQAGLVAQGKAKELNGTRGLVHQEGFALVWQPNGRDAWIAQWQGEASALETGVPGSDATHRLLTFGYQRKLSAKQRLDLYFSEDRDIFMGNFPEGANIGPDFTMGVRISVRF